MESNQLLGQQDGGIYEFSIWENQLLIIKLPHRTTIRTNNTPSGKQ
jgi:hypothetical protein